MKMTIYKPTEVNAKFASMVFYCDYPECFEFNGKECKTVEDLRKLPIKVDKNDPDSKFNVKIDIDTGEVLNWPKENTLSFCIKLVDEGEYYLFDEDNNVLQYLEGHYVPGLFAVNDEGYGDYTIMSINSEGFIDGWEEHIRTINLYKCFFSDETY